MSKSKTAQRQKEVLIAINCGFTFPVLAEKYKLSERGIKRVFVNAVMNWGETQKFTG